jgi:PAS domain S-box-containing protein
MNKEENAPVKVLFLEDNKTSIQLVESILNEMMPAYEMKIAKTEKEFLKFIIRFNPDVILSSYHLDKYSAGEAFELLRTENHPIPFIVITNKLSEEIANELVKKGVEDCVFKSNLAQLPFSIMKAVEKNKINHEKIDAEQKLKKEQNRFQTIFSNAPSSMINVAFNGEILEINPAGLQLLHADEKKIRKKSIFEFIHPNDLRRFKKFHNSVGLGHKKMDRFRIIGLKKNEYTVETSAVPLLDEEGHIISVLTINHDITEQVQARELINYHAKLFENISDAVVSLAPDFCIQSWNKGAEKMYGWKAAEVIGKRFSQLMKIVPEQNLSDLIQKLSENNHAEGELRMTTKKGKELIVLVSCSAMRDEQGVMTGFLAVHRDITEQKHSGELIRESKVRLENAQKLANIGYWDRDVSTMKGSWSKQMYKIFEFDENEEVPAFEDFLKVLHPDDRSALAEVQQKLFKTNDKISHQYRLQLGSKIKYILAHSQMLKNEEGVPQKLIGTTMDITELKMAKEKAEINEHKFHDLLENSPDAIFVEDEKGTILDVNNVACKFQGYTKEQLIGMNAFELIPPSYREDILAGHKKLFNEEESVRESYIWDKDWNARPIELKTNRIVYNGQPALLLHARDITKRRNAQKEKRETKIKYSTLTDQAPVAIFHADNNGKFLHANNKFLEIFEMTMEQVMNDQVMTRIHPEDESLFKKLLEKSSVRAQRVEQNFRLLIDKKIKYLFGKSNPLYNDDRKQVGYIGTMMDLTENVNSKEELMLTHTMFQSIFQHSPDPIFIEDFSGNILNANSKACKLQGLKLDEIIGKNIFDLAPEDQREEVKKSFFRLCDGTIDSLKASTWNKDGKSTPVEIKASLINYFDTLALLLHVRPEESAKKDA